MEEGAIGTDGTTANLLLEAPAVDLDGHYKCKFRLITALT